MGVSMPTGAGKTTVFVSLLDRIQPPAARPEATKSLIIVNTTELAKQAAERVHEMLGPKGVTVEIEQGQKYRATGEADVLVPTIL
jgi:ATP-dependent helicase IRC3